jgi:hypothetical protein
VKGRFKIVGRQRCLGASSRTAPDLSINQTFTDVRLISTAIYTGNPSWRNEVIVMEQLLGEISFVAVGGSKFGDSQLDD